MAGTQQKRIAIAGGIAVLLVLAALWVASRDRTTSLVSTLLYPEFAAAIPSVQRVLIDTAAEQPAVELRRTGDSWTVTQRQDFPADVGKIGVLLQNLAEARILEAKTATVANYPVLGVEDLTAAAASGVRIEVFGNDPVAPPLVDLIVGKSSGMEGTYVRKNGEGPSWLVNRLETARLPGAWLEPAITHIDTDRVHQVTLRPAGQTALTITKPGRGNADFTVVGRKLARPKAANGISTGLIALQLEDVRKLEALAGVAPTIQATYRMFDGLQLAITGWIEGDQHWIALAPSFDAALAQRFANDRPQDNAGTAFWRTPEQVRQEIDRLEPRVSGWAFRIPEYKYQGIFPATEAWLN